MKPQLKLKKDTKIVIYPSYIGEEESYCLEFHTKNKKTVMRLNKERIKKIINCIGIRETFIEEWYME